jgi:hypothetical protein
MVGSGSNTLRAVLNELGWSYTRLAAELRRHASMALPKTESMVTLISRWVNNHQQPDDFYRDLLSRGDRPGSRRAVQPRTGHRHHAALGAGRRPLRGRALLQRGSFLSPRAVTVDSLAASARA